MRVVTSPYLRLKRKTNHRYIFTNYLTDKIDIVTPGQYKLLKHLRTQTHVDTSAWPYLKEIEGKRLLDASRLWQYHSLRRAEIEVNSYCNWQCAYCPSATVKRSRRVMDMEHFHIILKKCMEYGSISTICLHVYSEPTIDSFFNERITEIARFGFHLELFTNASHLDNNKILLLKSLGNVKKWYAIIPPLVNVRSTNLLIHPIFTDRRPIYKTLAVRDCRCISAFMPRNKNGHKRNFRCKTCFHRPSLVGYPFRIGPVP